MQIRNKIRRFLRVNWRVKLVCLLCAIVVWLVVERLFVQGDTTEWDIDDVRIALPE